MKKLHFALCCILIIATFAYAHSGKTDGKGGHYNRSTGEYHYHHGYPAHTVCGVNCPYNNIDATNHKSSTSGKSNSSKTSTSNDNELSSGEKIYISIILSFFTSPFTTILTSWILSKFKNIHKKIEDYIGIIGYIESVLIIYFLI